MHPSPVVSTRASPSLCTQFALSVRPDSLGFLTFVRHTFKIVGGHEVIRPLSSVGAGAADLVLLPIRQYKQDGRMLHGLRKGAVGFVKTVTLETVHTSQKVNYNPTSNPWS